MDEATETSNGRTNRRSETRRFVDQYHNAEISIDGMAPAYVFRLRDISSTGIGILVKEGSELLNQIETGQTMNIKYSPPLQSDSPAYYETEIKHIAKDPEDRFKGHFIIGLSVIEKMDCPSPTSSQKRNSTPESP